MKVPVLPLILILYTSFCWSMTHQPKPKTPEQLAIEHAIEDGNVKEFNIQSELLVKSTLNDSAKHFILEELGTIISNKTTVLQFMQEIATSLQTWQEYKDIAQGIQQTVAQEKNSQAEVSKGASYYINRFITQELTKPNTVSRYKVLVLCKEKKISLSRQTQITALAEKIEKNIPVNLDKDAKLQQIRQKLTTESQNIQDIKSKVSELLSQYKKEWISEREYTVKK